MLKPSVAVRVDRGTMIAEFWDCLRLDPAPVSDLRRHFENHVKAGNRPELIVDLNGVEFAGSSALGGFLAIHRHSSRNEGRLIFCNVEKQVREVFRVSKLEALFRFESDVPAALAAMESASERTPPDAGPASAARLDIVSPVSPSPRPTPPPLRGRRKPS